MSDTKHQHVWFMSGSGISCAYCDEKIKPKKFTPSSQRALRHITKTFRAFEELEQLRVRET